MSIRFPFSNYQYNTTGGARFNLPSTAAQKPANTAFVIGIWVRPPSRQFMQTRNHGFLGRANTGSGGNDAYIRFMSQSVNNIAASVKSGGTQRFSGTCTLSQSQYDQPLLVLLIGTAASGYLVVVEPDGTQIVAADTTNSMYTPAMTSTPFMHVIGAINASFYGSVEDMFFIHGAFPEVGAVPDPTLVAAIHDGSQSIDTLDTMLTGGVKQCRYKMRNVTDLADAWGNHADLTPNLNDNTTGAMFTSGGPLGPSQLTPARTRSMGSQVVFGERGNAATATATIKLEGGTYTGITPAAIQARLLKEDGSPYVDWTTVDAAPSGGTWAASQFDNVPMVAGFLEAQFRAVDGVGAQIGDIVTSDGIRATAISAYLAQGQSQKMHLWEVGNLALPAGIRLLTTRQYGTSDPTGQTEEAMLGSATPGVILGWGMRQAAIEINTLYPGVPIHFMTVGNSGDPLEYWGTGGMWVDRWQNLAAHMGVIQPHHQLHYGHSSVNAVDSDAYAAKMTQIMGIKETYWGAAMRVIQCPTPRYMGLTTGSAQDYISIAREGARKWHNANPGKSFWAGSFHPIKTAETGTDPHPSVDDAGHGVSGALQAWASLMCSGAVIQEPLTIKSATSAGTTATLTLGPVN